MKAGHSNLWDKRQETGMYVMSYSSSSSFSDSIQMLTSIFNYFLLFPLLHFFFTLSYMWKYLLITTVLRIYSGELSWKCKVSVFKMAHILVWQLLVLAFHDEDGDAGTRKGDIKTERIATMERS